MSVIAGTGIDVTKSGEAWVVSLSENRSRRNLSERRAGGGGDTFLVRLRQVGGSPGSATTPCTFTYDLWPLSETAFTDTSRILAIAQQPQRFQRPTAGLSIQAPNGSLGLAATVNGQTILLIAFDERIDTEGCSG